MKTTIFTVALAWIAAAGAAYAVPQIETGADLVSACEPYSKLQEREMANAVHPHHCHRFLVAFFSGFAAGEAADRNARVTMMQGAKAGACVHLPDFLSYRDMAARIVAQAKRDPGLLKEPAAILAQRTLEHDFPCANDRHQPTKN